MIQRVQTLFLLLLVLAQFSLFMMGGEISIMGSSIIIKSISITSLFFGLLAIFSYKNRKRQILLNQFNIFINALLIGLLIYWLLNVSGGINFPEKGIELTFPLISLIGLFFANYYINKDEKLVKSVDRLR